MAAGQNEFSQEAFEALNHDSTVQSEYEAAKDRVQNARDAVYEYLDQKTTVMADSIRDFTGSGRSPQSVACDTCYMDNKVMTAYSAKYGEPSRGFAGFAAPAGPSSSTYSNFDVGGSYSSGGGSIAIR